MKNKLYFTLLFSAIFGIIGNAQSKTNQTLGTNSINTSSLFYDASSSTIWNATGTTVNINQGKGLAFPNADLSKLVLTNTGLFGLANNPNRFDGTVVYNTVISATTISGISVAVTPGFYYFSNPNKSDPTIKTSLGGTWTRIGGQGVVDITNAETITSTAINGAAVYAITGTFITLGSTAAITISKPIGMTGYYRMMTFQGGKTFRDGILSFDTSSTTGIDNVVTGYGGFSEVYPAGTYNYTLEYFK